MGMSILVSVDEIEKWCKKEKLDVAGNRDVKIASAASFFKAKALDITFCNAKLLNTETIKQCQASVVVCPVGHDVQNDISEKFIIFSQNPRLTFSKFLQHFLSTDLGTGIHETAFVGKSVVLGKNVYIGPNCSISGDVTIGDDTKVFENVVIKNKVAIGKNVLLNAAVIIGSEGFGFERDETGKAEKFPHFGGVKIEDNVEIGANTCIDRGTLDDTIIRNGAKIDNLVHVAHNTDIGDNSFVIALAMIGGGAKIGKNCWISPSVAIKNKIEIGDNSLVGLGSVVLKNVGESQTVCGVPAKNLKEFVKIQAVLKKMIKK
tara:strand:- start:46514 stop:47467 length:954 start_codon:yes stop_codon:yes gene_type:complete